VEHWRGSRSLHAQPLCTPIPGHTQGAHGCPDTQPAPSARVKSTHSLARSAVSWGTSKSSFPRALGSSDACWSWMVATGCFLSALDPFPAPAAEQSLSRKHFLAKPHRCHVLCLQGHLEGKVTALLLGGQRGWPAGRHQLSPRGRRLVPDVSRLLWGISAIPYFVFLVQMDVSTKPIPESQIRQRQLLPRPSCWRALGEM
jgi:hypothetical protein